MAGIRGNVGWFMAQKQTAKGTVATWAAAKAHKTAFAGGNIGPVREMDRLTETDSSRDVGDSYASTGGVEGSAELYVRDASIGFWLNAALGSFTAPTGSMPNFVHAITPINSLPYITVWKNIGDTLYEEYKDCKVNSLSIKGEAGQPLTATVGIVGLGSIRLALPVDNATPQSIESSTVNSFNTAIITLGGGVQTLISSYEINIENNVTRQQTDDFTPIDSYEGSREITASFDMIFDSVTQYNNFHYNGAATAATGSASTLSSSLYSTTLDFEVTLGANNSVKLAIPKFAYTEFPAEPQPGGDAIVSSIAGAAQRQTTIMTATVKNQVASYAA